MTEHALQITITFVCAGFLGAVAGWWMHKEYVRLSKPKPAEPYDDYSAAVNELHCDEYLAKLKADLERGRKAHKPTKSIQDKMRAYVHGRLAA